MKRLYDPTDPNAGGQFGLTPEQREALPASLEAGFYEIPQEATMGDVAEAIGISRQALSKRLRRAHGALVRHALTIEALEFDE